MRQDPQAAIRAAIPKLTKYIPTSPSPKQAAFLCLTEREAFFGGAGGGGKTESLLMAALQYVDRPGYHALLLMRTYVQLSRSNAMMDRCRQWLANTDAHWLGNERKWVFPSGSTLEFGHLDSLGDERRYDGPEFQFVGFDELTQFTETQYRFLFARLRRRAGSDVPLRMRSASNPGGVGHEWVKRRFVKPGDRSRPFVPARLSDNPAIDQAEYRASLAQLDSVTRRQREEGDWEAKREGALFREDWFRYVDSAPAGLQVLRYWDLAATEGGGDWTAGAKIGRLDGSFYILDVKHRQYGPANVERLLESTAADDGPAVGVRIEEEGGSSGKADAEAKVKLLAGFDVRTLRATGDKGVRARPLAAQAEKGNVYLVRGEWNADFIDELTSFNPDVKDNGGGYDDQVDAASGAFNALAKPTAWWADDEYVESIGASAP